MAADNQVIRIKKLVGKNIIRLAGRHNLREIQAEHGANSHISAVRTSQNVILAGAATAGAVSDHADSLMLAGGIGKLRTDAVRGLELVISLPTTSSVNKIAFFADALAWAQAFYGLPVISAVVHYDEAAPHAHIILLPLIDGRMKGSDLVGNRTRLQVMQASFFDQVGQRHGLTRPKPPQRISAATRAKSASLILTALQSDPDMLNQAGIESALLAMIGRDPEPLLSALGLSVPHPPKRKKTFVEIMTKPCKADKPIGFAGRSIPIGFDSLTAKNEQTLSCVGFTLSQPPTIPPKLTESALPEALAPNPESDYQRIRDDDHSAGEWDSETGDFIPAKPARDSQTILRRWAA